eukprot:3097046-Pleurochrysis_carterae.AAC.1
MNAYALAREHVCVLRGVNMRVHARACVLHAHARAFGGGSSVLSTATQLRPGRFDHLPLPSAESHVILLMSGVAAAVGKARARNRSERGRGARAC